MPEDYFNVTDKFVSLEIPKHYGFGGGTFLFTDEAVQYHGKIFPYDQIIAVSYQTIHLTQSMLFITVQTRNTYYYSLRTTDDRIKISYETNYGIHNDRLSDILNGLILMTKRLIEPRIIAKYMDMIFREGKVIQIGKVYLWNQGYRFKSHNQAWSGNFQPPNLVMGHVFLSFEKRNRHGQLKYDSELAGEVKDDNVGLLPELIMACHAYATSNN